MGKDCGICLFFFFFNLNFKNLSKFNDRQCKTKEKNSLKLTVVKTKLYGEKNIQGTLTSKMCGWTDRWTNIRGTDAV